MLDDEKVMEFAKQCYSGVSKGGTKVAYENTFVAITAYKVGEVIRIDIKKKN